VTSRNLSFSPTRNDAQGVVANATATPIELAPNLARLEATRRLPEAN
jgi:hypothetical protein